MENSNDKKNQYGLLIEMYAGGVAANQQDFISMERLLKRALVLMSNYTGCDDLCDDIRAVLNRSEERLETDYNSKKNLMAPEGVSIH
jgi:hypothetical protein